MKIKSLSEVLQNLRSAVEHADAVNSRACKVDLEDVRALLHWMSPQPAATPPRPPVKEVSGERCQDCGHVKEDVRTGPCPYDHDVMNKETIITVCKACRENRARDI